MSMCPSLNALLRLTLERDTDGTGKLEAEVTVHGFSGTGSAWFHIREIAGLAEALIGSYPLQPQHDYALEGGIWKSGPERELERLTLGLRFYTVGSLGLLGCRVQLAVWPEEASPSPHYATTVELRLHYEPLRSFGQSLLALAQGSGEEALLPCEGI